MALFRRAATREGEATGGGGGGKREKVVGNASSLLAPPLGDLSGVEGAEESLVRGSFSLRLKSSMVDRGRSIIIDLFGVRMKSFTFSTFEW